MTHWNSSRCRATRVALAAAILAGAGLPAAQAQDAAQDAARLHTQSLAATCAQCHGTQGRQVSGNSMSGNSMPGSSVPGLAGMPAPQLIAQMKAFQSGSRPSTVMQQIAKGYSDARIERLAAFFATQAAP